MNASLAYILRNLGRRRTRTALGVAGIFLTCTLLTAIQVGLDSVSTSYVDLVSLQAGQADVLIRVPGGSLLGPLPMREQEVRGRLTGEARLQGFSPRLLGIVQIQSTGKQHYAVLIGVDPEQETRLQLWGISPRPSLAGKGCALSRTLADKLKATSGSKLLVSSPASYSEAQIECESIVEKQMFLPQQIRDFVVVNLASAREILGTGEDIHLLAGSFRDAKGFYDARNLHASVLRLKDAGESMAAQLGMDYEVRLPKAEAISEFQNFSAPLRAFFGVFTLLTLTIAGLLIYSLISISVEERIREYAILRTLGAKSRDVIKFVLGESVILCFLGVIPGAFSGVLLARAATFLLSRALKADTTIGLEIGAGSVWLTIGLGLAVGLGSALVPALHATRWRIVDALEPLRRGRIPTSAPAEEQPSKAMVWTGLALSTLSGVIFFALPMAVLSGSPSLIGSVVLCLLLAILVGLTLLSVSVIPFVQRFLLWCVAWKIGVTAEMAGRNLWRHRRRHSTTALLFTLSVSLVMFLASLVALSSRTALALVEQVHGADLRLVANSESGEGIGAELSQVEGVGTVSRIQFLRSRSDFGTAYDVVVSDLVGMKRLWIVPYGVDSRLPEVIYRDRIVWETGSSSALDMADKQPVGNAQDQTNAAPIILSTAVARFLEVGSGDQVQLTFQLGAEKTEARFRVAGVCSALPGVENFRSRVASAVGSGVLIASERFEAMTRAAPGEIKGSIYLVRSQGDAASQKQVASRIRDRFDVRYQFGLQCTAEQKEQARVMYWATQIFFGLLLGAAVVIAVLALIASMAATVLERKREIGVLKALGMRHHGLYRLFLVESVILTLSAGIAGGAIGFILAWLFVLQASVLMEFAAAFTLPYLTFLASLAISVVAGVLAAHVPTRGFLRMSAAEIMRT